MKRVCAGVAIVLLLVTVVCFVMSAQPAAAYMGLYPWQEGFDIYCPYDFVSVPPTNLGYLSYLMYNMLPAMIDAFASMAGGLPEKYLFIVRYDPLQVFVVLGDDLVVFLSKDPGTGPVFSAHGTSVVCYRTSATWFTNFPTWDWVMFSRTPTDFLIGGDGSFPSTVWPGATGWPLQIMTNASVYLDSSGPGIPPHTVNTVTGLDIIVPFPYYDTARIQYPLLGLFNAMGGSFGDLGQKIDALGSSMSYSLTLILTELQTLNGEISDIKYILQGTNTALDVIHNDLGGIDIRLVDINATLSAGFGVVHDDLLTVNDHLLGIYWQSLYANTWLEIISTFWLPQIEHNVSEMRYEAIVFYQKLYEILGSGSPEDQLEMDKAKQTVQLAMDDLSSGANQMNDFVQDGLGLLFEDESEGSIQSALDQSLLLQLRGSILWFSHMGQTVFESLGVYRMMILFPIAVFLVSIILGRGLRRASQEVNVETKPRRDQHHDAGT